ncbi:unnamed protein product [Cuscuta campestris]|uniref:Core domain-containing protein n=2 Tax=Cuscuta sect. Cleistogrammica TaxID=1824901 RepID=A0A484M942_9ASTE|nr:hypothetical protein DM860_007442 [Cuscuta australis]VFQ84934.1 unnamed protein product [Cuscuta campestris]
MATRPHSRSLILRAAPFLASRIRRNATLLRSRPSSSSAMPEQQPELKSQNDSVFMTENCVRRMKELQASEPEEKMLRLSIEAGGCSGFQYEFSLDGKANADDRIFEKDGVKLVVDNISFDFVKGATVDYVEELIRSAFQVSTNPSAVGGCSCKSSFMVK